MPRRLIVMRHAKSSWHSDARTDHERPLNKRGERDAPRVGRRLAEVGWVPEIVLSSDSTRTRQTYFGLCRGLGETVPAIFSPNLYHGGYRELLEEIVAVPEEITTVLVLGHNPGWQELVTKLTGESVPMKTATAALLVLPDDQPADDWRTALQSGRWQVVDVIQPRSLLD